MHLPKALVPTLSLAAAMMMLFLAGDVLATQDNSKTISVQGGTTIQPDPMGRGMLMPMMNPARGRKLFASKGCVVCHSVNGIGGKDAPPLDASTMAPLMNPFEFAARMWNGAEPMIYMQQEELDAQIEFSGDELADIIAFAHHLGEQRKFSEADIPPRIRELMKHWNEDTPHEGEVEEKPDELRL